MIGGDRKKIWRFYIGYICALFIVVTAVDAIFGTLYARYVILYTGGIFMAGLAVGQRYEQGWLARQSALERRRDIRSGAEGGRTPS